MLNYSHHWANLSRKLFARRSWEGFERWYHKGQSCKSVIRISIWKINSLLKWWKPSMTVVLTQLRAANWKFVQIWGSVTRKVCVTRPYTRRCVSYIRHIVSEMNVTFMHGFHIQAHKMKKPRGIFTMIGNFRWLGAVVLQDTRHPVLIIEFTNNLLLLIMRIWKIWSSESKSGF